ncbi:MAG TPA: SIMPL domain-containing protein [Candidatus Elarobacter sp.]|jgi:hypothetical protein|nr:SIMPL domain-containing protein [Candidatus Elarobacter sp.]
MNALTTSIALAAALAAAALPAAAQAPAATRAAQRLEVSGQGSVDRMPDRVTVTLQVVTNDDVATRATSQNNVTYNALLAKLHGLGIADAAIRTTGYDLVFNARPAQVNPQFATRYGYVVTRTVSVASDRTDQAGPIIDAAVSAGVASIGGVAFGLRDTRSAYRAAEAAAVADADAQAQALASAAHLRVVRMLTLSATTQAYAPRPLVTMRTMAAVPAPPTDVQASSLTVSATVTATYELAP